MKTYFKLFSAIFLLANFSGSAQAQVTNISAANFATGTNYLCPSSGGTNDVFYVDVFFIGTQNATFTLDLSDGAGVFGTAQQQALLFSTSSTGPFAVTGQTTGLSTTSVRFYFKLPANIDGTAYKIRVKNGSSIKDTSSFSSQYRSFNSNFFINNRNSSVAVCSGTNATINIDVSAAGYISPLDFPNLVPKYKWYKVAGTGDIFVGTGTSLTLPVAGFPISNNNTDEYYAKIDYGTCSSSVIVSNRITIINGSSTNNTTNSSNGNIICEGSTTTLSTPISGAGYTYQWKQQVGGVTSNALGISTNASYQANVSGTYYCAITAGCTFNSLPFVLNVQTSTLTISPNVTTPIVPGQIINVTATVASPATASFSWSTPSIFPGGGGGGSSSTSSYDLPGTYTATANITNGSCTITKFVGVTLVSPSSYALAIAAANFTACVSQSATLQVSSFNAVYNGTNTAISASTPGLTYQWFFNNNLVAAINGGNNSTLNVAVSGTYKLAITLQNNQTITSNNFVLGLKSNDVFSINATGGLCSEGSTVQLAASVANGQALSNYTYAWTLDGVALSPAATTSTITVLNPGTYKLTATNQFGCIFLGTYVLNATFSSAITFSKPFSFYLPSGTTINVTAAGGDSYLWLDPAGNNFTNAPTVGINSAGIWKCKVNLGLCVFTYAFEVTKNPIGDPQSIPNMVSANNDGFNDKWQLPAKYYETNSPPVSVEIYDNLGKIVYQTDNYQNNWPTEEVTSYNTNAVFYYIVKGIEEQKGTITLLK